MKILLFVFVFVMVFFDSIAQEFSNSARIKAGDSYLDMRSYSAPLFYDFDKDGLKDLILGELKGFIRIYKNVGTEGRPLFDNYSKLQAGGADIVIPNY